MLPKLTHFYEQCLLPEILDSRYNRNMPIRDPSYILEAQKEADTRKKGKKRKLDSEMLVNSSFSTVIEEKEDDCLIVEVCKIVDDDLTDTRRKFLDEANASLEEIERNVLPNDKQLNDASLDKLLRIIRETSDFETQSVLYLVYPKLINPSAHSRSVQIIGGNCSGHWRCIFFNGCKLFVYDSLPSCTYKKLSAEEKVYIASRYPSMKKCDMIFLKVTRQPDSVSCGIYAADFAVTIALGGDPSKQQYSNNVTLMRRHFIKIITENKLSEFPKE